MMTPYTGLRFKQEALDALHIRPRSRLREAFPFNFSERLCRSSWKRIREEEGK